MLDIKLFSSSKNLLSPNGYLLDPVCCKFSSLKGRFFCFWHFCKKLAILPFSILHKLVKTGYNLVGMGAALIAIFVTFANSDSARRYFETRLLRLAKDIGDWILYPFALFLFFLRHILAIFIHPRIYLGY